MENNNEVIMETEATSEPTELTSAKQDDVHVMTAGESAIGFGIIGGLAILGWELAIKPIGKKAVAAGKKALAKAKAQREAKFKKAEEEDDLVELKDE